MTHYMNNGHEFSPEFYALWEAHVPAFGESDTVGGEMVRAVGRINRERFQNGFGNNKSEELNFLKEMRIVSVGSDAYQALHDHVRGVVELGLTQSVTDAMEHLTNEVMARIEREPDLLSTPLSAVVHGEALYEEDLEFCECCEVLITSEIIGGIGCLCQDCYYEQTGDD